MKGVVIAMVVLAMIQLMVEPGWAISCGQVDGYLAPCVPYLIRGSGSLAPTCCDGQVANRYSNLKDDASCNPISCCQVRCSNGYPSLQDHQL
ncbi:hypothetical protein CsSME_00012311 [Camellia sinensis var. sinensis]